MRRPRSSTAGLALLGLAALLAPFGCSSKTPEVDTAEVSRDGAKSATPAAPASPSPAPASGTPGTP